jgi:hypothetical protein
MTKTREAKLQTVCPACGRPVTWIGTLDLDEEIGCTSCGKRGTVREFVTATGRQRGVLQGNVADAEE